MMGANTFPLPSHITNEAANAARLERNRTGLPALR
jgi:hypothetical protein